MRLARQQKTQLQIALLGMDERSRKIMSMFFKGPCEGHAVVVEEKNASVAIIDTRFEHSKQLLEQSLTQGKMRAIIVLSSQSTDRIIHDKIMYLDKPITANPMFEALDWAKDISEGKLRKQPNPIFFTDTAHTTPYSPAQPEFHDGIPQENTISTPVAEQNAHSATDTATVTTKDQELPEPTSTSTITARVNQHFAIPMQIEEVDFSEIIGTVVDIDMDDPTRQRLASYDPNKYYQGYVQRAFNKATQEGNALQLTLGWNPLIILPHNNQIWWDADDKLLKAVSDIEIKTVSITAIDPNEIDESTLALEKKQDMDAFLWKLALWSSRGRYPESIDVDSLIQLKRWPNLTRHIITPHALRISAFLIKEGPHTLTDIAKALSIELRYVSIFISAASAVGLIHQLPRPKTDTTTPVTASNTNNKQKRGILNKILNKLLGR